MLELEIFPFITSNEFEKGCEALVQRLSTMKSPLEVMLKKENGAYFVEIKKPLGIEAIKTLHLDLDGGGEDEGWEGDEDDDKEALPAQSNESRTSVVVEYHIVLSPGYQVPVLYFQIAARSPESGTALAVSLVHIYKLLIDVDSRTQIEKAGVMGGVSQGDHPILGQPYYFVHPCNTANALEEWRGYDGLDPERYLMIWLGLVGSVVGLFFPANALG